MKNRIVELSVNNRKEIIVLPVNPQTIEFGEAQLNQRITLLNAGEANLLGNRGLAGTSLSSFFPSKISPFYRYAKKEPKKYIRVLKKWKDNGQIIRVIITDLGVNMAMVIDNLTYHIQEGSNDISYTIDLSEYRKFNVASVKTGTKVKRNGLKDRPNTKSNQKKSHTVRKGETLWGIAKKYYGSGSAYTKIYNANKNKIKNPNQISIGQILTIP